ncbi:Peptidase E [Flagellimonas taeanensis]|uniref:Peptidase E n=1 Tax=Flagellimonas taeanensis TaxID=1005926 RepID=A0A1M6SG78_9FLAO|nr:peptidase E [Allomuricauda taeanensis]SFB80510.1 Peptidase E [Allomuricauda taeanensis]SHK43508.1 Peptidase E [Allomuricauda taeanensis]
MNRRNFIRTTATAVPALSFPFLGTGATDPSPIVRKLFVYGGDFDRGFTKYVASLTGKKNPRICFLPTATGDASGYVMRWFETCADLPIRPFVQRSFISSYNQKDSFEAVFTSMDAILVGGGNTLNMMAIWKAQGMDMALRKAWESGVVLGGGSAGSLCWFEHGTTDSRPRQLTTVEGLGLINGSHCPHYDAEGERKPLYLSKIESGEYKPGFACDDRAGIYFENGKVKQVVSLDQDSNSYFVGLVEGEIEETVLQKVVLPPAWP